MRLLDIASGQKRKLEASFSGGVTCLSFTQCGRYLACAGAGAREVLIFDVRADAKATPLSVVVVAGSPVRLAARTRPEGWVEVMCLLEEGGGCVFRVHTEGKSSKRGSSKVGSDDEDAEEEEEAGEEGEGEARVHLAQFVAGGGGKKGGSDETPLILCGCFCQSSSSSSSSLDSVFLALGKQSQPNFSATQICDEAGALLAQVLVPLVGGDASAAAVSPSSLVHSSSSDGLKPPLVLGPNEMGGTKRPRASSEEARGDDEDALSALGGSTSSGELTLEQRLETLSASMTELEQRADVLGGGGAAAAVPTSDSLVTLLEQALQAGDDALLEQVREAMGCVACVYNSNMCTLNLIYFNWGEILNNL